VLVLHLDQLLRAFLPSPTRCLDAITQLLPHLTVDFYTSFIGKVHSATSRLLRKPTSAEEFAEFLEVGPGGWGLGAWVRVHAHVTCTMCCMCYVRCCVCVLCAAVQGCVCGGVVVMPCRCMCRDLKRE